MNEKTITKAYIRTYSDNGQIMAYVEWSDGSRTEGVPSNRHMQELLRQFVHGGGKITEETW